MHDDTRCLYCRQLLGANALELISKYREYLESQIAKDIEAQELAIQTSIKQLLSASLATVQTFCQPTDSDTDEGVLAPGEEEQIKALRGLIGLDGVLRHKLTEKTPVNEDILSQVSAIGSNVETWHATTTVELETLRTQNSDREKSLSETENQLRELQARMELDRSWGEVVAIVGAAKRHDKLRTERTAISNVLRHITLLSNKSSEQLVNNNFKQIFQSECAELRAPELELEFSGREGGAQRKKKLPGGLNPSKVLSEGEQKVLAIADFLAETKMSDNSVPVIFDDPVSSLDHRRIGEVARRIGDLASNHQVVVFTHDIWLVTHLLEIFEKSNRCVYYQVTDDRGKGTVTVGTGPRWDTINSLRAKINSSIEKAKTTAGEERQSHIRDAYDSIRSWCELFVEQEVFAKVTERYQPNVRMTSLGRIKVEKLENTIQTVTIVFEEACRYIEAHSQPLPTLSVAPKLADLENSWEKLRTCRTEYNRD